MPRTETGQEQATEQVVLGPCVDCGSEVGENDRYAESRRYNRLTGHWDTTEYRCEECFLIVTRDYQFHCDVCEEDHYQGGLDYPEWFEDENTITERFSNAYSMQWCLDEWPECVECGERASLDNWGGSEDLDEVQCHQCRRGPMHEWNFVPILVFKDIVNGHEVTTQNRGVHGIPYLGLELEMEDAREHVREIVDLFHGDCEHIWLKHDGSLMEDGVEMVTHPATFEWYMEKFPWDALGQLSKMGVSAFHTDTAGTHVHISSDAFTTPHLFKFLAFHQHNPIICQTIGQRRSARYCSWTNWLGLRNNLMTYAKKHDFPTDRYVAVNLTERNTIELRYFKGNISPTRVRKNIQWVDALYRWTKQVPGATMYRDLTWPSLFEWLDHPDQAPRYPDLLSFIREREIAPDGVATTISTALDV